MRYPPAKAGCCLTYRGSPGALRGDTSVIEADVERERPLVDSQYGYDKPVGPVESRIPTDTRENE